MQGVDVQDLLSRVREMEELLRFPSVPGHLQRAERLAMSIARATREGPVSHLAMQVISEANALRPGSLPLRADESRLRSLLEALREALQAGG